MIEQGYPEEEVEKMRGGMEEEGWMENSLLPPRYLLLMVNSQHKIVNIKKPIVNLWRAFFPPLKAKVAISSSNSCGQFELHSL